MGIAEDVAAIRSRAGVARRTDVRTLRLSGPDRVRFLNGMVTNDVASLSNGEGLLAVKTNNRGRVEGQLRVRATDDAFLIDLREFSADRVLKVLDMFIIMDDCAVEDVSREVVTVLGPEAAAVVATAGYAEPAAAHGFVDGDVTVIADRTLGVSGFELHCTDAEAVLDALATAGAHRCDEAALDVVRIEAGVPIDGPDVDDDTIPMEARLEHAISTEKGCYVGQEVIARAMIQGQVAYHLVGLRFDGEGLPAEGAELHLAGGDKSFGEVCSVVHSPTVGAVIGLGYIHRKHEASGTAVEAKHDGAAWTATIVDLPFA